MYRADLALEEIRGYVREFGDTISKANIENIIQYSDQNDEQYELFGHRCKYSGSTYLVGGHPELRWAVIVYIYELRSAIEEALTEELPNSFFENATTDDEGRSATTVVAEELLTEIPTSQFRDYKYRISKLGAQADCDIGFSANDGYPETLIVSKLLFPYETSFSISEFARVRGKLLRVGPLAKSATERAFSVTVNRESPTESDITIDAEKI